MTGPLDIPAAPTAVVARGPMRLRHRPGPRVVVPAAAVALLALFGPSAVALHYAPPGEDADILLRPDQGWAFVVDAVRLARGARLGSGASAEERAGTQVWAGPPAVARSVRLVHSRRPFTVPAPPIAGLPATFTIRPRSALTWLVRGEVGGRSGVTIGALDLHSGVVVWDIRPRLRRAGVPPAPAGARP